MEYIIDSIVVNKISAIIEQWNSADAVAQKYFTGWVRLAARAGIEHGALLQIGKASERIAEALGVDDETPLEILGERAFKAYKAGSLAQAREIIGR